MLGTPPAFTLSQDQTLQFFSEVLKFRLSFYDFPKDVGTASGLHPPRCDFGAVLEALQEPELAPRTLFGFKPSADLAIVGKLLKGFT